MDINKHPLIKQAYNLCLMIERIPASKEQTDAIMHASALMDAIDRLVSAPNVRDDLAGANPCRQAENNPAAGSSPSTCWADFSNKEKQP